jgi:hypothetical protein
MRALQWVTSEKTQPTRSATATSSAPLGHEGGATQLEDASARTLVITLAEQKECRALTANRASKAKKSARAATTAVSCELVQ